MKILVAVKRVVDFSVKVRVKPDNSGVELENTKMSINPFCEIALEEALRIREKQQDVSITAVTVGQEKAQETLRHALGMGADEAIHVVCEQETTPLATAKILQRVAEQEAADLVILGKQSIDGDNNQTGQMLAALLDWPQGTFASNLVIDNKQVKVTREIDGGLETLALTLPAVITTDLRLNEPRYLTLPNIMKAKRKPINKIEVSSLGLNLESKQTILRVEAPADKQPGIKVASVEELVDKLRNEAKVI